MHRIFPPSKAAYPSTLPKLIVLGVAAVCATGACGALVND